jgi:hypothetical protein
MSNSVELNIRKNTNKNVSHEIGAAILCIVVIVKGTGQEVITSLRRVECERTRGTAPEQ